MHKDSFKGYFGAVIAQRRKAASLSQEKLAELSGLHRTYVGSVERGERNISIDNICRLAEAINIRVSKLLALAEELQDG